MPLDSLRSCSSNMIKLLLFTSRLINLITLMWSFLLSLSISFKVPSNLSLSYNYSASILYISPSLHYYEPWNLQWPVLRPPSPSCLTFCSNVILRTYCILPPLLSQCSYHQGFSWPPWDLFNSASSLLSSWVIVMLCWIRLPIHLFSSKTIY